ncbi:ABC transporter ATP-binding protein [Limibacillus sp. MBR-115]|jgi:branched-chain amino acid transport system ATP-binding protein|uniref:ABC transporter ATP-binding protein n=1 Tax=Limibacillus sp. MBR-115 TaxID=3156465 RepID=UPI003390E746
MSSALVLDGISKSFGGIHALSKVSFTLKTGGIHALIGPNGAGKTTLVSTISGALTPDTGTVRLGERLLNGLSVHERSRLGLSRTYQLTSLFSNITVRENLALSLAARETPGLTFGQMARRHSAKRFAHQIDQALEDFGLQEKADANPAVLSHGDRRRLELAMAIITEPKVLLLDEPLAGLSSADAETLVHLIETRLRGDVPILLIEHDMEAVFNLADDITVLVNGEVLKSGTPDEVRASSEVQAAYLSEDDDF